MTPHPCFLAVPIRVRISVEILHRGVTRKQPEIFSLSFHHPTVALSLVVGERHIWIGQEAQNSLFVVFRFARLCLTRRLGRPARGCHSASAFASEPGGLREK